jgi:hypothetical protein
MEQLKRELQIITKMIDVQSITELKLHLEISANDSTEDLAITYRAVNSLCRRGALVLSYNIKLQQNVVSLNTIKQ